MNESIIGGEESKLLQKLWIENTGERIIKGKLAEYKINKNKFLGRGGFGIVYGGLRRTLSSLQPAQGDPAYDYKEVAIKQFKKSDKWRTQQDQDKEVLLLSKYGNMLNPDFVLQVIEIFRERQTQRYFLITPLAVGGSLCDRLRLKLQEQDIYQFALRLAQILKYIHYDALMNFHSKQRGQENKQRVSIIHRDVKPQNIVLMNKEDIKSIYLLDFGIAKIGYSDFLKGYNNCGTSYYKAPEISQGRIYNAKVDIYSFGCTLFEVINDGQKLITTAGINTRYGDRDRFIKSKLVDLHLKLQKSKKYKFPGYWIRILSDCLAYDIKRRHSSEELLDFLQNNHYSQRGIDQRKPFYGELTQKEKQGKIKREIFEINFENFRLSVIQDVIFTIFQFIYFEQPRISKFTLYVMLKFIVLFFLDKYNKLKQRCKLNDKTTKYNQLKAAIEIRRIQELKDKSQIKINKELEKQISNDKMQSKRTVGPNQDMIRRYPELLTPETAEPKRILYQFCYQKKNELLQSQKFAKNILTIISYMEDFDYYDELKVESADLENYDVEILSIRRLNHLKKVIDDRLSKDGLKSKLQCLRVENSVKSNVNKQENKTDLDIESNF